ncbi:MAG: response regulator [Acidobacteria bacterium]|nr:MAG: response regulator [Acidobacteriota bacterium]
MPSVLVIDDEADVRASIAQVLGRVGFDVVTAENGLTGTEEFFKHPADVVIVDFVMPRSNGAEVIRKIRASFPGARIIAVSGGGQFGPLGYKPGAIVTDAYLALARQAGADAVMSKPFHRKDLIALVRSLVKN